MPHHRTLTEVTIRAVKPPESGTLTLWDGAVKHFGLRVSTGGAKAFIVLLGSGRRQTIGRYPVLSLAQAREKAKRILAERALGRHQTTSLGWQAAVEKFIEARRSATRPGALAEYQRSLKRYFAFGTTRVSEITKQDISRKLEKLNRVPSQKAHALVICKMFFRWALVEGFIDVDPTAGFKRSRQPSRTRVLSDDELRSIWRACQENRGGAKDQRNQIIGAEDVSQPQSLPRHFCTIVQLLILMGQRRGETAALQSSWINKDTITLPPEITKNGRQHCFPIGVLASKMLPQTCSNTPTLLFPARGTTDRPFNGWSNSKAALDEVSGVKDWTLHDLRRTCRTIHARIGTPPHVAERAAGGNAETTQVENAVTAHRLSPHARNTHTKRQRGGITTKHMANICFTSLSIQKDADCKVPEFTDGMADAIRKDIEEHVSYDGESVFHYEDDALLECDLATRWNVPTDALKEIANKHDVKIRAVGREDAVGFVQVVCIKARGVVVLDEEIGYAF
jgi:integrase